MVKDSANLSIYGLKKKTKIISNSALLDFNIIPHNYWKYISQKRIA